MIIDLKNIALPEETVRAIGIDLGTTNSTVAEAVWSPETPDQVQVSCLDVEQPTLEGIYSSPIVPSVVAIAGDKTFIGEGAKRLRSRSGEFGLLQNRNLFFDCKNDIGTNRVYHKAPTGFQSAVDIGGHVIRFLRDAAVSSETLDAASTVVTVPASFQAAQRKDTSDAAKLADVDVSSHVMLDEPIAAFLEYANSHDLGDFEIEEDERRLLVFDFGGGTCDVGIFALSKSDGSDSLNVMPLAVSRYHRLGGGDIDAAILYEVLIPQLIEQNNLDKFALGFSEKKQHVEPALIGVAEALKVGICDQISRLISFGKYDDANKDEIVKTQPGVHHVEINGKTYTLQSPKLTATQFEELMEPFLDIDMLHARSTEFRLTCSIFAPIEDAIERANLDHEDIDFVLLAGGSSRIPQVSQELEDFLPSAVILSFPERDASQTAIAKGAALHALSLALTGKGLVRPVAHDRISIKTANGDIELIPKGTELPFSRDGADALKFRSPEGSETTPIGLRVEVVGGTTGDEQSLLSETWTLNPPISKGEILRLSYSYDANQVLTLQFARMEASRAKPFERSIENPFTNVVNPNKIEIEIEKIESDIRSGKIPSSQHGAKFTELADKYSELGYYEKAIEIAKRLLRQKAEPDSGLLNDIATYYGHLGDHDRAERFYREAGNASHWSGPWFNLALSYRRRRKFQDAMEAVRTAISREDDPPYRVLEALLSEAMGNEADRDQILTDHLPRFGGLRALSDWELGWYLTGCRLAENTSGLAEAEAEQKRRRKANKPHEKSGLLPEAFGIED